MLNKLTPGESEGFEFGFRFRVNYARRRRVRRYGRFCIALEDIEVDMPRIWSVNYLAQINIFNCEIGGLDVLLLKRLGEVQMRGKV